MGTIVEVFDDSKKRYVAQEVVRKDYNDIGDAEYKGIEAALIRYADELYWKMKM